MELIIISLVILSLGTIILKIFVTRTLKNLPTIELIGTKLTDDSTDDINEAIKYLTVVNKD